MANYGCAIRTNYFHVEDPDQFQEMMSRVSCDDYIHLFVREPQNDAPLFAFGCYGTIRGLCKEDGSGELTTDDNSYEDFVKELQKFVKDQEAIIIVESGNEKLRYVTGDATIITKKEICYRNICDVAMATARELLGDPEYTTRMDY